MSKKKGGAMKWVLGCGGAAGVALLLLCGCGGWLFHLEEGRDLSEPGEEVARASMKPGKASEISFVWSGTNYAFNDIWLEMEGEMQGEDFVLEGEGGCALWGGREPDMRKLRLSRRDDVWRYRRVEEGSEGRFKAWIKLEDAYSRSSAEPIRCAFKVDATQGRLRSGKLVVTRLQRPSDFFSF